MSVEANKTLVKHYIDLLNQTDPAKMLVHLTDDFLFESMLQKPKAFNVTFDREAFANVTASMSTQMISPLKVTIVGIIGEGDCVAVEAKSYGEMKNGKTYENAYHFLFKLRDGKICNVREYSCSYTAYECLGDLFVSNDE